MATVILTLTDKGDIVDVKVEWDPPIFESGSWEDIEWTPAQMAAIDMLSTVEPHEEDDAD